MQLSIIYDEDDHHPSLARHHVKISVGDRVSGGPNLSSVFLFAFWMSFLLFCWPKIMLKNGLRALTIPNSAVTLHHLLLLQTLYALLPLPSLIQ